MNNNNQILQPKTTGQTIKNSVVSGSIFFLFFKLLDAITYIIKSILMFFIRPLVSLVYNKTHTNNLTCAVAKTTNCTINGKEYTDEEIYNFVNNALNKLPASAKMKLMKSFEDPSNE